MASRVKGWCVAALCCGYLLASRLFWLFDFFIVTALCIIRTLAVSASSEIESYDFSSSLFDIWLLSLLRCGVMFYLSSDWARLRFRTKSASVAALVLLSTTYAVVKLTLFQFWSNCDRGVTIGIFIITFTFPLFSILWLKSIYSGPQPKLVRRNSLRDMVESPRPSGELETPLLSLEPIEALSSRKPEQTLLKPDSCFIRFHGSSIHCRVSGSGPRAVLLLHGFGASAYTWNHSIRYLQEVATVVAIDRPGFGLSSRSLPHEWEMDEDGHPLNPYTLKSLVDLTLEVITHFKLRQVIIVGHSSGASLGLLLASQFPLLVSGVIAVAPTIYSDSLFSLLQTLQSTALGRRLVRQLADSELGVMALKRAWSSRALVTKSVIQSYRIPFHFENWDIALHEIAKASTEQQLKSQVPWELAKITCPVALVGGCNDPVVNPKDLRRLSTEIATSDVSVLENCGHFPQEEVPNNFLQIVLEFLYDVEDAV